MHRQMSSAVAFLPMPQPGWKGCAYCQDHSQVPPWHHLGISYCFGKAKAALSSWGAALPPSFLLRGKKSQALTFNPTQPRPAPAVPSRHPVLYCSCGLREHYCRSNATGRRTGRASTGDGHCRAHLGAACRHPESPSSLQPGASCKDRR